MSNRGEVYKYFVKHKDKSFFFNELVSEFRYLNKELNRNQFKKWFSFIIWDLYKDGVIFKSKQKIDNQNLYSVSKAVLERDVVQKGNVDYENPVFSFSHKVYQFLSHNGDKCFTIRDVAKELESYNTRFTRLDKWQGYIATNLCNLVRAKKIVRSTEKFGRYIMYSASQETLERYRTDPEIKKFRGCLRTDVFKYFAENTSKVFTTGDIVKKFQSYKQPEKKQCSFVKDISATILELARLGKIHKSQGFLKRRRLFSINEQAIKKAMFLKKKEYGFVKNSLSHKVYNFFKQNKDKAFFIREIAEALIEYKNEEMTYSRWTEDIGSRIGDMIRRGYVFKSKIKLNNGRRIYGIKPEVVLDIMPKLTESTRNLINYVKERGVVSQYEILERALLSIRELWNFRRLFCCSEEEYTDESPFVTRNYGKGRSFLVFIDKQKYPAKQQRDEMYNLYLVNLKRSISERNMKASTDGRKFERLAIWIVVNSFKHRGLGVSPYAKKKETIEQIKNGAFDVSQQINPKDYLYDHDPVDFMVDVWLPFGMGTIRILGTCKYMKVSSGIAESIINKVLYPISFYNKEFRKDDGSKGLNKGVKLLGHCIPLICCKSFDYWASKKLSESVGTLMILTLKDLAMMYYVLQQDGIRYDQEIVDHFFLDIYKEMDKKAELSKIKTVVDSLFNEKVMSNVG